MCETILVPDKEKVLKKSVSMTSLSFFFFPFPFLALLFIISYLPRVHVILLEGFRRHFRNFYSDFKLG